MKRATLILALIMTQSSFAAIKNSDLENKHLTVLESAILKSCGYMKNLTQVESTKEVIVVDQGIRDFKFKTVLTGIQKLDQGVFDEYLVTIESNYADMYDHTSKDWGVYSVDSVSCQMQ